MNAKHVVPFSLGRLFAGDISVEGFINQRHAEEFITPRDAVLRKLTEGRIDFVNKLEQGSDANHVLDYASVTINSVEVDK